MQYSKKIPDLANNFGSYVLINWNFVEMHLEDLFKTPFFQNYLLQTVSEDAYVKFCKQLSDIGASYQEEKPFSTYAFVLVKFL